MVKHGLLTTEVKGGRKKGRGNGGGGGGGGAEDGEESIQLC